MAQLNTGSNCPVIRSRLIHIQVVIEVYFQDKHEFFTVYQKFKVQTPLPTDMQRYGGEADLKPRVAGSIDACDS